MSYMSDIDTGMLYVQDGDQLKEIGRLREVKVEDSDAIHNTHMRFLTGAEVSFKLDSRGRMPEVDWEAIDRIIAWMNANHVIRIAFDGEKWVGFKDDDTEVEYDLTPDFNSGPVWNQEAWGLWNGNR